LETNQRKDAKTQRRKGVSSCRWQAAIEIESAGCLNLDFRFASSCLGVNNCHPQHGHDAKKQKSQAPKREFWFD
jgi:hypothetical protein